MRHRVPTSHLLLIASLPLLVASSGCPVDWDTIWNPGARDDDITWLEARYVIGQPSLTAAGRNRPPEADTLNQPFGLAWQDGILYIVDTANHRVLGYEGLPQSNGASARFALAQPDFTTAQPGRGAGGLFWPGGAGAGGNGLVVADRDSNRVLVWQPAPAAGPVDAARVLGQPNPGADLGSRCRADGMSVPEAAIFAGGRVLVADSDNSRLLIWNSVPDEDGAEPDLVFGQNAGNLCLPNRGMGVPDGASLDWPAGMWSDGQRLAVADRFNNRVLLWDSIPQSPGDAADRVLGQPDMGSNAAVAGGLERGLSEPVDVHYDGRRLWVVDHRNHRVLAWDGWPTANHRRPYAVIGQPDLGSNQANNTGAPDEVNGRSLWFPQAVWSDGDRLLVADTENDRVLYYRLPENK
jgi:hypothetical protein